jgi:ribosomal protein S10
VLRKFNIDFKITPLRLKKTLLKSPHVTKRAKESFEVTFFKFIVIINFNNKLLKILRGNVPNTMHLKCIITS